MKKMMKKLIAVSLAFVIGLTPILSATGDIGISVNKAFAETSSVLIQDISVLDSGGSGHVFVDESDVTGLTTEVDGYSYEFPDSLVCIHN